MSESLAALIAHEHFWELDDAEYTETHRTEKGKILDQRLSRVFKWLKTGDSEHITETALFKKARILTSQ